MVVIIAEITPKHIIISFKLQQHHSIKYQRNLVIIGSLFVGVFISDRLQSAPASATQPQFFNFFFKPISVIYKLTGGYATKPTRGTGVSVDKVNLIIILFILFLTTKI
jgi:hypothetical protein